MKKMMKRKIRREAQCNSKVVNQTKVTTKVSSQFPLRLIPHKSYQETSINFTMQQPVLSKFSNSYRLLQIPKNGRETMTA